MLMDSKYFDTHKQYLTLAPSSPHKIISQAVKAAVAGAAVTAGVAISPAFAGDVGAGEQVFNANCAACHAGGQNVIMPEKTLEKAALDQYLAGGRSEASVRTQVTNGKNAMPAFGGRLSEDDIANVASYVIATSEKGWDE
jgi:cytochrome c6